MNRRSELTKRRLGVARLLSKYGPLSIRGIEACTTPPLARRKLNQVLLGMERCGQLTRRFANQFGRAAVFYRLPGNPAFMSRVADALETNVESMAEQGVRSFDLLHIESCGMWAEYLACLFPEARVIHENQFSRHPELSSVFLQRDLDREFIPDLVAVFPSERDDELVYVAFEIERSPKAKERLVRKLRKYADETRFDGLVYICSSDDISTHLNSVYNASVLKQSNRVKHYGENFFLFSDGTTNVGAEDPVVFNASLEPTNLRRWVSSLSASSLFDRRDSKFKDGQSCPQTQS
jgi:hypothetical protein